MAKKTINQALKDLFLGLGGDASALADNTSVSDYIADLESAIKTAATAELPTPAEANVGKVATVIENEGAYSWGAEEVVVPQELPTPAVDDIGKVVSVVSDGESGAEYSLETPSGGDSFVVYHKGTFSNGTFTPDESGLNADTITSEIEAGKNVIISVEMADYPSGTCIRNTTLTKTGLMPAPGGKMTYTYYFTLIYDDESVGGGYKLMTIGVVGSMWSINIATIASH